MSWMNRMLVQFRDTLGLCTSPFVILNSPACPRIRFRCGPEFTKVSFNPRTKNQPERKIRVTQWAYHLHVVSAMQHVRIKLGHRYDRKQWIISNVKGAYPAPIGPRYPQQDPVRSTCAAHFVRIGSTRSYASFGPPGMSEGPFRAPSSPPEIPIPMKWMPL